MLQEIKSIDCSLQKTAKELSKIQTSADTNNSIMQNILIELRKINLASATPCVDDDPILLDTFDNPI